MAMARAEMSLAAVRASTAGNENSRAHATIDQEISAEALAEELKTLADAMFQFVERLTEISHKSLPLRKAIDLLKKIQTDSTQDATNDQAILEKTECCMGTSDDLISVDKKGWNYHYWEETVRIHRQSPDIAGGADVNEDDLRWFCLRGETQVIVFLVIMQRQVAAIQVVPRTVKLPQILLTDSTEDIPVVQQSLLPTAQPVQKTRRFRSCSVLTRWLITLLCRFPPSTGRGEDSRDATVSENR